MKSKTISELQFDNPFYEGLQYNPPARGTWNIVHTGMLIPEAHQIYVCAQGCLRGVILTAAEMNLMERMSWVSLREKDMWNGEMESRVIEGVSHIVDQMEHRPPCVLVYLSCMHMFEGCDFRMIASELSDRYPGTDFVDCYMTPTMRKTISPDAMMKSSLYAPVRELDRDPDMIALVGCDRPTDRSSDIYALAELSGKRVWEINSCKTYEDYLGLGAASLLVSYLPVSDAGVRGLAGRIGAGWVNIPLSYDIQVISDNIRTLGQALGIEQTRGETYIEEKTRQAKESLRRAADILGDTPVTIDYSATPAFLSLARVLLEEGMNVTTIYTDTFPGLERRDYDLICEMRPDLRVYPTMEPDMLHFREDGDRILAIGQKAAYFNNTEYFVNIADGGGMYGLDGISRMVDEMIDAYNSPKDTRRLISHKGIGCASCL